MARTPSRKTKNSVQAIKNLSFDEEFNVQAAELLGYDAGNDAIRRLSVDENGNIQVSNLIESAQDAVGSILTDTATIDFTYDDVTPKITADVIADSINDTHIDWGTGANQVSADDIPDGAVNAIPTLVQEANWDTAYGWGDHSVAGYLKADGTVPLTANWDAGAFEIRAETLESDVATGTAPLTIASTTLVTNLNADLLDGQHASAFLTAEADTLATVTARGATTNTFIGLGQAATALDTLGITNSLTTDNSTSLYIQKTGDVVGTSYGQYTSVTGVSTTNVAGYFNAANAGTHNIALYLDANGGAGSPPGSAYALRANTGDISLNSDEKILWGTLGSEDVSAYRSAIGIFKTDNKFIVGGGVAGMPDDFTSFDPAVSCLLAGDDHTTMGMYTTRNGAGGHYNVGGFRFYGRNDAATPVITDYAGVFGRIVSPTAGAETGKVYFVTRNFAAGANKFSRIDIDQNGALWFAGTSNYGTGAADTNLYPSAANTLKTDDTFDANKYKVNGAAGANFSGAVTNITVVDGLVTAVS